MRLRSAVDPRPDGRLKRRFSLRRRTRALHLAYLRPGPSQLPGEAGACLAAFESELDYIFGSLRRLGVPRSEIEDLGQEMFVAMWRSWSNYDPSRPLRPYLFGIAFRLAHANERKRRREVPSGTVDRDDPGGAPSDRYDQLQDQARLMAALEQVPLVRRALLIMHELDEVPVGEIAKTLRLPLFTVYSRLRKGRRELEKALRRMAIAKART